MSKAELTPIKSCYMLYELDIYCVPKTSVLLLLVNSVKIQSISIIFGTCRPITICQMHGCQLVRLARSLNVTALTRKIKKSFSNCIQQYFSKSAWCTHLSTYNSALKKRLQTVTISVIIQPFSVLAERVRCASEIPSSTPPIRWKPFSTCSVLA